VPAIELVDVHTSFDGEEVLRGVSLTVREGAITGLLGLSGVGKTTCIRRIAELLVPDSGDVRVDGRSRLSLEKLTSTSRSRAASACSSRPRPCGAR
jgi:ABC-type multidrug transport system ATPase subunit